MNEPKTLEQVVKQTLRETAHIMIDPVTLNAFTAEMDSWDLVHKPTNKAIAWTNVDAGRFIRMGLIIALRSKHTRQREEGVQSDEVLSTLTDALRRIDKMLERIEQLEEKQDALEMMAYGLEKRLDDT